MKLSEIIARLQGVEIFNFREHSITGITCYSKEAEETKIFATLRGFFKDGKDFLSEASSLGTVVVLSDEKTREMSDKTVILSKNPRKTMAEIANILFGNLVPKMKIIGITGTKGKTTTAKFLTELISSRGEGCIGIGTLGIEIYSNKNAVIDDGKRVSNLPKNSEKASPKFYSYKGVSENTTPESYVIYEALNYAASLGISYAVIEASSIALESMRVWKIPFFMTLFTNLSSDHIGDGEHASFDEYKLAKRSLFTDYGAEIAVVNSDSPYASFMSGGVRKVIKIGADLNSDFKYEYLGAGNSGAEFLLNGEAFSIPAEGEFNASDAALALASAACLFDVDIKEFKHTLAGVRIDGRFEIYEYLSRRIIIDFAHNAASFRAILGYARERYKGRIIVVFGSVGGRNHRRRRDLALAAEEYADVIIITSDNPGYENPELISAEISSYLSENTISYCVTDRYSAILRAVDISLPGDAILLLGKGHESFQLIGASKLPFSERGIIMSLGARPLC